MKKISEIKRICNLGCGTMGFGTAIAFAQKGYEINLFGRKDASIERAMKNIRFTLTGMKNNQIIDEQEMNKIISRIHGVTSIKDAAKDADFVIESVAEDMDIKQSVYKELEKYLSADIVFATDSSGLLPSQVASKLSHPERFVVAHFWNPPHLIPLVEVVPGKETKKEVVEFVIELLEKIGKKPVGLKKEAPRFIGNRLQFALLREALYCVKNGFASAEDVDTICKYSIGRRLGVTGPIESADLGGLDIFYSISAYLNSELAADKLGSEMMRNCVEKGLLGAKSGSGLYNWDKDKLAEIQRKREKILIDWLKKDLSGEKF